MTIRLYTLGAFELRDADGNALQSVIAQPKRAALLAYLAIAGNHGSLQRDTLFALFWPELDEDRARGALNQAIHFLRRSLGPDAIVSRNGAGPGIDPERLWCDAVAFEESCQRGRTSEALELYRGDLLEGVHITGASEFERWLDGERKRLAARYTHVLEQLAAAGDAAADSGQSVAAWRRLAARDPLSSRIALGLMRALVRAGDVESALRHARIHETLLRQELNVGPDPAVVSLVAKITSDRGSSAGLPSPRTRIFAPEEVVSAATVGSESDTLPELPSTTVPPTLDVEAGSGAAGSVPLAAASSGGSGSSAPLADSRRSRGTLRLRSAAAVAAALAGVLLLGQPETSGETLPLVTNLLEAGRAAEKNRSPTGIATAKSYYHRAIELDPDHAPTYAALSRVYSLIAQYGYGPVALALDSARLMATKAVARDGELPDAHTALALALADAGDADGAERAFIRAIGLDVEYADAHYWYSIFLLAQGRVREARREAELATRYDPLVARGTLAVGRYATFIETGERPPLQWDSLIAFEPGEPWHRRAYALYLGAEGRCDEARREIVRAEAHAHDVVQMTFAVALVHRFCGDSAAAVAAMERAKGSPRAGEEGMWIAMIHAPFGERDSAFAWLDRHVWTTAERMDLRANRWLDSLRTDPRFRGVLERAGLQGSGLTGQGAR